MGSFSRLSIIPKEAFLEKKTRSLEAISQMRITKGLLLMKKIKNMDKKGPYSRSSLSRGLSVMSIMWSHKKHSWCIKRKCKSCRKLMQQLDTLKVQARASFKATSRSIGLVATCTIIKQLNL